VAAVVVRPRGRRRRWRRAPALVVLLVLILAERDAPYLLDLPARRVVYHVLVAGVTARKAGETM